jgi:nucleoside diphosphate kinase
MINNNNQKTDKGRTEKRISVSLVTFFASFIGAVLVISGSAAQAQTQNMTSANNMTSAEAATINNSLQQQIKYGQDADNAVANLSASQPEANNPFDPFTNGDNK